MSAMGLLPAAHGGAELGAQPQPDQGQYENQQRVIGQSRHAPAGPPALSGGLLPALLPITPGRASAGRRVERLRACGRASTVAAYAPYDATPGELTRPGQGAR